MDTRLPPRLYQSGVGEPGLDVGVSQAGLGVLSLVLGLGWIWEWEKEKVVGMGEEGDADVGGKRREKARFFAPEGGLRQWLGRWERKMGMLRFGGVNRSLLFTSNIVF